MPDVEFSEEQAYSASLSKVGASASVGGLRALPIKLGLAKDETGADIILIAVAIIALILMVVLFLFGNRSTTAPTVPVPDASIGGRLPPPGL
ncbi:MAG: hypothetical protein Q7R64_01430 [bacterium]|nr:hypothetical protein [bacterium]